MGHCVASLFTKKTSIGRSDYCYGYKAFVNPTHDQMIRWFIPTGKPIHILLTKADKLSRNQTNQELQKFKQKLKGCNFEVPISSKFLQSQKDGLEAWRIFF